MQFGNIIQLLNLTKMKLKKSDLGETVIDFGAILLLHTIVTVAKKRAYKQLERASKINDAMGVLSINAQLEQFDQIETLLKDLVQLEWEQRPLIVAPGDDLPFGASAKV